MRAAFRRLSLQSKLVMMLASTALLALVALAAIGYAEARQTMGRWAAEDLAATRRGKTVEVKRLLTTVKQQAIGLAGTREIVEATKGFREAYREFEKQEPPPKTVEDVRAFYEKLFLPVLQERVEDELVLESMVPKGPASTLLQGAYIATNPNAYDEKGLLDDSGKLGKYDELHGRFHPELRGLAAAMGFEDLLLIDADSGEIVYSSRKATDFGTSLKEGPYSESSLARLYAEISRTRDRGAYRLIDFERYRPAANEPTAFVASPIFDGPDMVGVLALRFPADRLESLLTGDHGWAAEGLGETGEVFLAGADGRMRSASRFLIEDPEDFGASLKKAGQHGKVVEEVGRLETTVLALPAGSLAAERAIEGATGLMVERDYRGRAVLESYGPIDVEDLRWAIVAKRDVSDAFGMVRSYGQRFLVATVGLGVVATAVAALLGWLAARPVRRLAEAAKQLALGKTDVTLDVPGDELGELAASIGDLAKGLKSRSDESARHERALERLLRSILPRPVAERRKTGYAVVVETFPDVSLLEAEITGLDEAAGVEPERAVRLFHELVVALDEAADRRGVEKIKTVGPVYLAACGISEQRPDHASRVLDFAQDLLRAIGRFNGEKGLKLSAKVGVHVGPVVGGVVGRQKFAFDLWGEPVEVVRRLRAEAGPGMIRVSEAMRERVHDLQTFEVVDADGGERDGAEPILWVLRA